MSLAGTQSQGLSLKIQVKKFTKNDYKEKASFMQESLISLNRFNNEITIHRK